ncbi:MAG: CRISPR-associated endonuclease Cas1 [Herpetosiphonaceae bacterium]|nr:CRISPR-associated endonuclease Cas1 [Herpetosiphonaceae bacterium]
MATLYVEEQGAHVRKKDNQILVTKEGQTLREVPLAKLDQVVLMGRGVQISTALLVDLIERGVPVTLTNQHGSKYYGSWNQQSRFGELRSQQTFLVHTSEQALALARTMIQAKLHNQRALLQSTGWSSAGPAVGQITNALRDLAQAQTLDQVRGYEGAAANAYFSAWRAALPPRWSFGGRAFYPPPDPVNALLSFGYTLALHDVLAAIQIVGLDPYLGTFHVIEAGRPSLALDLLEEFRPLVVDRLVLELVRTEALPITGFERPPQRPDAVYLGKDGRALFIDRYEALLQTRVPVAPNEHTALRRVLQLQAQAIARVVRGEQAQYVGYTV